MSDLPPEGSSPSQPAGGSGAPSSVPRWAESSAPEVESSAPEVESPAPEVESPAPEVESPAREIQSSTAATELSAADAQVRGYQSPLSRHGEIQAWANDPAVAQVPPHWARPVAASTASDSTAVDAPVLGSDAAASIATPTPVIVVSGAIVPSPVPNPPAGWYAPAAAPASATPAAASAASASAARPSLFARARWLPTLAVAAIIAAVTLGGIGLDQAIASPSAGTVAVGGSVIITAASGWVLTSPAGDTSQGIQLQKGNAVLTAQVISSSYHGTSAAMVSEAEQSLGGSSAQVSYGNAHQGAISGNDTTYVTFEAAMTSGTQSGIVDGELVCMVVGTNEIILVATAPQGHLEPAIDDVSAMLKSVRARG